MDVISSSGGAGGVLQPPKPPPALRASKWEKILKSMSQFIPYFSVSSSGDPCKVQQTEIQTAGILPVCPGRGCGNNIEENAISQV